MEMIVDAHPSVAIIKSKETEEFLFSRYDETYPVLPYRLASNTIGGNPKNDRSPFSTWEREISEEFNNQPPKGEELRDKTSLFAPLEDILKIRNAILENARAYADFYFTTPGLSMDEYLNGIGRELSKDEVLSKLSQKKRKEVEETGMITRPGAAIFSVFYSIIPAEEIERSKFYLNKGQRLSTEGGNRILTHDQLVNGIDGEIEKNKAYLTAHCTPFIMQDFFGLNKPLYHLPGDNAVKLATPVRAAYNDYRSDNSFIYNIKYR